MFLSLQLEIESLCGKLDDVVVTLRQLECNFNSGLNVPSKKMTTGRTKRNKPQLEPLDEGTVQRQVENLRQCQSNSDDYEIISKVVSRADSFEETFSFQWFMSMLKDRCSKYDCLLANVIKVIGCCRSLLEDHSESGKIFNGTEVKSVFDVALKVNDKLMSVCHERMRKIVAPLVEKFGRSGDSTSLSLATKWNSANCRLISAQLKVLRTNQKWTELKQVAKRALIQFSESQLEMELSHFNSLWRLYEFIGYCKEHLCLSQIEESSLIDSLSKITIRGKQKMEVKLIPNKGSKNRKHLIEIQNSESSASVDLKKDLEQQEKFSRTLIKKGQNLLDTICSGNYNIQRQLQEILIMLSLSRGGHQECFPLITGAIGMGFRNQFAYAAALKSERAKL